MSSDDAGSNGITITPGVLVLLLGAVGFGGSGAANLARPDAAPCAMDSVMENRVVELERWKQGIMETRYTQAEADRDWHIQRIRDAEQDQDRATKADKN